MFGNTATHFQELLLEGMCDRAGLPAALEWLNAHCGSETAQIIVIRNASSILDSAIIGTYDPVVFRKEEEYLPINPRAHAASTLNIGNAVQDFDFIDDDAISRDPAYQELLIPAGVGRFAGSTLSRGVGDQTLLGIARPFKAGSFDAEAMARFCKSAQSAIPVIELSKQIVSTRANSLLDTLGPNACAAILGKDGRLIEHTAAFEDLLHAGLLKRGPSGQLDLMSDAANQQLAESISYRPSGVGGRFTIAPRLPDQAFVCTVVPVPPLGIFGGRVGRAVLFLERMSAPRRLDRHGLIDSFSLSEQECEVCEHLYAGESIHDIAAGRNISIDAANVLLRQIQLKTGTRKMPEILALLSRFTFSLESWRPFGPVK